MKRLALLLVAALASGPAACKGKKRTDADDPVIAWVDHPRAGMKPGDFLLEVGGKKIAAATAIAYPDSKQKLVMVVLVQGDEAWMGNETYQEGADRIRGAHPGLPAVIEALAKAGNPGSQATLVTYSGNEATVRYLLGEATGLTPAALGDQRQYGGQVGAPLLAALEHAHRVLAAAPKPMRRVLVVIGNGAGEKESLGRELDAAAARFHRIGAHVYAIHHSAVVGGGAMRGLRNLKRLGMMGVFSAGRRETMALYAEQIALRIRSRYHVRFGGVDAAAPRARMRLHIGDQFRLYAAPPAVLGFEDLPSIDAPKEK